MTRDIAASGPHADITQCGVPVLARAPGLGAAVSGESGGWGPLEPGRGFSGGGVESGASDNGGHFYTALGNIHSTLFTQV